MHIILVILKIIGIILAAILGLLLLAVLIVLLVPVRYRLNGAKEPDGGRIWAKGKVSWLASIFSVTFGYEKDFAFQIRLFGIPLRRREKKDDMAAEPTLTAAAADSSKKNGENSAPSTGGRTVTEALETERLTAKLPDIEEPAAEEPQTGNPEPEKPEEKEKILDRVLNIFMALWEKLKGIPHIIRSLRDKLRALSEKTAQLKETAGVWIAFLNTNEVRGALRQVWNQTKGMIRHILPQKIRIRGRFGFDDPALTGQITGLMSMIPAFYAKDISVVPDFTRSCLEGEFFIKGRIRAGSLLVLGLKILLDSNVRKAYKNFKKTQEKEASGKRSIRK